MKIANVKLVSTSAYSQGGFYQVPKLENESPADYEDRTWMNRLHWNENGMVVIPPMAFKNALDEAAKFRSTKIPGKSNATYTKHFVSGVMVLEPMIIGLWQNVPDKKDLQFVPIHKDDVKPEPLFVPSDGKPGGGKRVMKKFPKIDKWEGTVVFHVVDDTVTEKVFEKTLSEAGKFIGIGRFRPSHRGFYGRFKIADIQWTDERVEE